MTISKSMLNSKRTKYEQSYMNFHYFLYCRPGNIHITYKLILKSEKKLHLLTKYRFSLFFYRANHSRQTLAYFLCSKYFILTKVIVLWTIVQSNRNTRFQFNIKFDLKTGFDCSVLNQDYHPILIH